MGPRPPRILVVDDNASLRENLAECLEIEGYEVALAADGAAALAILEEESTPAAVLLDLMMPGLSGRDVVERIRANPRLASVRVVMTTGHPNPRLRDGVAADVFLPKPFGVQQLLAALDAVGAGPRRS
jgi:CheY-like chemotaxis protein